MNHPILGELDEAEGGGWGLTLSLPAFQPFTRWYNDGGERPGQTPREGGFPSFWVQPPPG